MRFRYGLLIDLLFFWNFGMWDSSAAFVSLLMTIFVFMGYPACYLLANTFPTSVFYYPSFAASCSIGFSMYSSAIDELLAILRLRLTSGELLIF